MSYREMLMWAAYRNKHGALCTAARLETQLASLQAMVVQAMGGKAKPQDFLPGQAERPSSESGIDMEQALSAFKTMGAIH